MGEEKVFLALADGTRLKIVKILLKGEQCACRLPSLVGRAQPTISLQLKKLFELGIIGNRKEGIKSIYFVKSRKIAKLIEDAKGI
ncbi:MAG: metalloregulator ArsR/SmtB family transcription factor [Candidatus Micrarchaeota archaeon]